ncbi:hypothetical protein GGR56DRAFT_671717 [Xylariaceae sp. FL0804]|nr:hypothetical protein GGR56DRAFT_671717 [Xylariaceae sp. FL0804]
MAQTAGTALKGLRAPLLLTSLLAQLTGAVPAPTNVGRGTDDLVSSLLSDLGGAVPTATPSSIDDAVSTLSSIWTASATPNLLEGVSELVAAGLTSLGLGDVETYIAGIASGEASSSNVNTREPSTGIFPSASDDDAPYSIDEDTLRGAIYIPEDFQYGANGLQPIILLGGTGNPGYITYAGNIIPLLQNNETSIGDPVWVNVPGFLLDDVQGNAEYVAYAVNYISGISNGTQVAVFGWSQGNMDAQWAFKYWPSTRARVTDLVAFSPGYHGTVLSDVLGALLLPLPPAWLQSEYTAELWTVLRADGGDSAYVPTTNIYSTTDEVDQPQSGDGASGRLLDARGVGVANVELQTACAGRAAGGYVGHEGVLYNPLAYALARSALANDDGPGSVDDLDESLDSICSTYLTPGLDLSDFLATENDLVFSAVTLLLYPDKGYIEPAIRSYAQ